MSSLGKVMCSLETPLLFGLGPCPQRAPPYRIQIATDNVLSVATSAFKFSVVPLTQNRGKETDREREREREESTAMAGVSFLSSLPFLLPRSYQAQPSLNLKRINGAICCQHKFEGPEVCNDGWVLNRRDALICSNAVVGVEMMASCGIFAEKAAAADLIQRRQRSEFLSSIKDTLATAIKEKPELVPSILTLALNDAVTYDKATKSGGANGSIRLSSEISRPENTGLSVALNILTEAKREIDSYSKGGPLAFADLIQYGAQAAVKKTFLDAAIRKCGGNEEKGRLLYTAYGSAGQWRLFDIQFGRTDAQDPDPEGRTLRWDKASVQEMKDKFKALGFGPRQLAVMSAFLGPDQLATEAKLATDPEVRPWVEKYQRSRETVSQTDYEVDLITTLTKLSSLGQQINYEAYTYPVQKIELGKLKL